MESLAVLGKGPTEAARAAGCKKSTADRYLRSKDARTRVLAQRRAFLAELTDILSGHCKTAVETLVNEALNAQDSKDRIAAAKSILDHYAKMTRAESATLIDDRNMIELTPGPSNGAHRALPSPADMTDAERIELIRKTSFES